MNAGNLAPFADCTPGSIKLVDGANNLEGRVEVCINNIWGSTPAMSNDALVVSGQSN